jgi:hypothetical protein
MSDVKWKNVGCLVYIFDYRLMALENKSVVDKVLVDMEQQSLSADSKQRQQT